VVLFLPFHIVLYYAGAGSGSYLVGGDEVDQRLNVSSEKSFSKMNLAVTRHHSSRNMARIIEEFGFGGQCRRGSVGLKVGLIAEQECDIYIHPSPRTKIWDTCGPQVILEEAGGKLTDMFGQPLRYNVADLQNHNGILATNGVAHQAAVEKLQPLLDEFGRKPVVSKSAAS
jgi:3'(2'), 5'-bisphosphate nucleotidase